MKARLILIIDGCPYALKRLKPDKHVASVAWSLQKHSSQDTYDIAQIESGPECECKGWLRWGHCRHVTALLDVGLLPGGHRAKG